MKFIFIAVNYNGYFHTKNYLTSLQAVEVPEGDALEVIIVDNNSADGDLENIRNLIAQCSFARLIAQDHNTGYFRGLNAGIEACSKNADTLLIIGNNDLKFAEDFLAKLKGVPYENDVLVIAPNITTLDGRQQNPHVVTKVPTLELIKTRIYFSNYYVAQSGRYINLVLSALIRKMPKRVRNRKSVQEFGRMKIKRGIGACYVLTPHFFHYFQRLDDRVFLWGEEALLSHQVESVGGTTLYDPSIHITHCESASVRFIQKRERYEIVKASYKIYRRYL